VLKDLTPFIKDPLNIRQLYSSTMQYTTNLSPQFYLACIDFEEALKSNNISNNSSSSSSSSSLFYDAEIVRELYLTATNQHGKDNHELWISFIDWEAKQGNFDSSATLYWLAKQTLVSPEKFISHAQSNLQIRNGQNDVAAIKEDKSTTEKASVKNT